MANSKISALTSATTPLAGTEVLPIVQSNATVKVATNDLTVKNVRSNATTGILQIAGPSAGNTRTMTTPDANFTVARTDAANSFTGDQTLSTGNLIQGTAAKGINFTANTGAAGMTSQLLNWYEEGTWTPAIQGSGTAGTYQLATASGWYTRIGRQVTVIFNIKLASSITGGGTGFLCITGLPFNCATTNATTGSCMLGGVNFTSTAKYVVPNTRSVGSAQIILEEVFANAAINDMSITIIVANNTIQGTLTYLA